MVQSSTRLDQMIVLQKRLDHQLKISKFESRPAKQQIPADRLEILPNE